MSSMEARLALFPKCALVILKECGLARVLNGSFGMTFPVDSAHVDITGTKIIVHVRDYRYMDVFQPYQIWTMDLDRDCELLVWNTHQGLPKWRTAP